MVRRHPIIFGFLLLTAICAIFSLFTYSANSLRMNKLVGSSTGEKVGVVNIDGIIRESKETIKQIKYFADDDAIKAVVLRIDSPGGGVVPSQEIHKAIIDLKKENGKKVVASFGSISASGGYLIACAADKIVANSGTITGSISAVMHFANMEELMKKVGMKASAIKSGKFKDIGSPTREMTDEEKALLQEMIDDIYDQFLDVIVAGRKISKEELKKIADGRIFSGRQAKKLGLVDELGDLNYAVRLAGKLSGIKGKPEIVYPPKEKKSFWELLLQETAMVIVKEIGIKEKGFDGISYVYQ